MQHPAIEAVAREAWFKNRQGFGVANELGDAFSPISLPSLALIRTVVSWHEFYFQSISDVLATSFSARLMNGRPDTTSPSNFEKTDTRKSTRNNLKMWRSGTLSIQTSSQRTGRKCMTISGESSDFPSSMHSDHPRLRAQLGLSKKDSAPIADMDEADRLQAIAEARERRGRVILGDGRDIPGSGN